MPRYAVLHDLHDPANLPVGLLVESARGVRVYAVDGIGGRSVFDGEYTTIEPDGSIVTYRPGMDEYWDYVLLMLSRTFLVGQVEALEELSRVDVFELFHEKVIEARQEKPKPYVKVPFREILVASGFVASYSFAAYPSEVGRDQKPKRRDDEDRQHDDRHPRGGVPVAA
jgi:hypothetical protein